MHNCRFQKELAVFLLKQVDLRIIFFRISNFSYIYKILLKKWMKNLRAYPAAILLLLFSCYYCGISMFSHAHIMNGSSIVHSHLGGSADHEHDDSQYAVIDILSQFQSEYVSDSFCIDSPFLLFSEICTAYEVSEYLNETITVHSLRGPPQA